MCASVDTSGTDALAAVCKAGTIRVATDPKYKPASWYNVQTGQWNGFDVEVAQEIAKRLGVNVELQAPEVGSNHGRFVERPLGPERGLDDRHGRA